MRENKFKSIIKIIISIALLSIFSLPVFPWGDHVHYQATKRACEILSNEFGSNFKQYIDYIADNGSLPDVWKTYYNRDGYGVSEGPNHYCDYDYYLKLKRTNLDQDFHQIQKHFANEELKKGGTVIWAVEDYSKLLKRALENRDYLSAFIYMAVLAHYIEDIHQPLHATENYDGQLTGNRGIHLRYEVHMINRYWKTPRIERMENIRIIKMKEIRGFTIEILEDSLSKVNQILDADMKARKVDKWYSEDYYKALWKDLDKISNDQIDKSVEHLIILLYSIWVETGKPEFPEKQEMLSPTNFEVQRVVYFGDPNQVTEKTKTDEKKQMLYSIVTIGIFALAIQLLKK